MKKLILMSLCMLLFAAGVANAGKEVFGPYPNFNGWVDEGFYVEVPMVTEAYIEVGGKTYNIGGQGGQRIDVSYSKPLFAATYIEVETPFDVNTDDIIVTEILALNLQPGLHPNDIPELEGFNPSAPEIEPNGLAWFKGKSGTFYTGTVTEMIVSDLPTLGYLNLPTFPGPTMNIVYVSQTEVPAIDTVPPEHVCDPHFLIDTEQQWQEALGEGQVLPIENIEWEDYMDQWADFNEAGEPYPDSNFLPPMFPDGNLYVYEGNGAGGLEPNDAGLVMTWGDPCTHTDGDYSSAWKFEYKKDPDLSNCTVTVMVTAPQQDQNGVQINQVSFGLKDNIGNIRAWYWNCPVPVPWNVPTMLKIDTSKTGMAAATPAATGYMNNPGFDITKVQWIIVDENGSWVGGQNPAPPPGPGVTFLWNYWHWMMVAPNTTVSKGFALKWSQPPVVIDTNDPPTFLGWDEYSDFQNPPIVADDWLCKDDRPITDIHWWGSFIGWNQPNPPQLPSAFHIGIWTDVPDSNVNDPLTFSHPGTLVWENYCDEYTWNFAGFDEDPCFPWEPGNGPNEACFQFTQFLDESEWFYQEPNDPNGTVYWLSIAPLWNQPNPPQFPWGWKSRPHYYNDAAVSMHAAPWRPPQVGITAWNFGNPITLPAWPDPDAIKWDMAFELTTVELGVSSADLHKDGLIDFQDLAIFADQWLTSGEPWLPAGP